MRTSFRSLLVIAGVLLGTSAAAAPLAFNFRFAETQGTATATGTIVFESTLLPNPGFASFALPDPAVLSLNVTVSGSDTGNGTFSIADFTGVFWDTNGATLDLTRQVVGQPTQDLPWGTVPSDGNAGDFNLFSGGGNVGADRYTDAPVVPGGGGNAPSGVFFFILGADGGSGEEMPITSFQPLGVSFSSNVPTLREWSLVLLAALFVPLTWIVLRRRRRLA